MKNQKLIKWFELLIKQLEFYADIKTGKEIGQLKKTIKDAILDGLVKNNKDDVLVFLSKIAKELNIKTKNEI